MKQRDSNHLIPSPTFRERLIIAQNSMYTFTEDILLGRLIALSCPTINVAEYLPPFLSPGLKGSHPRTTTVRHSEKDFKRRAWIVIFPPEILSVLLLLVEK